uniref:Protein kinase domain-containing protein n=1 Tax=Scleropages formosus TaxID=113540 RepID=A0A8C9RLH9_SCLFO
MGAVHALRGDVVTIKIPFSGKPDPVITWQKGQEIIDNSGHHQVIITRSFTSLVFPNGVQRKDAGYYIISAKNRFGADQQTVELDVADVPDAPKNIMISDLSRDSVTLTWSAPAKLVMIYEFISGVDIFERLGTANFDLTEQEIVRYIRQVCEALQFLHSHKYAHFDIKPENIIYTTRKSSNIKIIEMGQARLLIPGENIRIQFTAPEYCAPEVHQHDMVSTVTDMWSVGVLTYVLLSGLNPFTAENAEKMIEKIYNVEYSFDAEAFKDTIRWTKCNKCTVTELHFRVTGLLVNHHYEFRVSPTNPVVTKEDKLRVLNYDEEVSDSREVSKGKVPHSDTKNVHNKYVIAEELGHGEFGIVHRCIETSSQKTFMAKFVKVKGADQALIRKEITTLNVAQHMNFLCLHESFESPEELVMIYDFISGVDIFERISIANFELTEWEIVRYIRQVCEALEFLHSKNYGHFDIKPENIVFTTRSGYNIKIIEIGQARYLTPGDNLRIQFTTAEYCAPEIHQCDMVSTVTDMWSVGVLVYVLLSGLNPFTAETNQQMIEHISKAEYSFDDETFKSASLEALDFVDRLLTKERKHRMTATEALRHPWLKMNKEQIGTKAIKTTRHKRYHQMLIKKESNVVVSAARVAYGGAIRSQRGIKEASISDSGKYTVKAKNMYGQCSATASLNVLGKLLFFFMHHDLGIISVHEQVVSMKFVLANICMTIKKS